jgi:hypothetical protein
MFSKDNRSQEHSHTGQEQADKPRLRIALVGGALLLAGLLLTGMIVAGVSGSPVATSGPDIDDDVYTNESLRLIASGAPVDDRAVDGELNETVRAPLVRDPRRPWTVSQAVERSAFADGYRTQLDDEVHIPVEESWVPLEDVNPQRQWVVGIGQETLQSTEHPDKSLTVEGEERGFSSGAPVRNAYVRYNDTAGSFTVDNPLTAEVQNKSSGEWVPYNSVTVVNETYEGFESINAATVEVPGQEMRIKTADSLGFMPIRGANIVWRDASLVDRLFGYSDGWSIANEAETEVYDGSYTTFELYHQNIVSGFEPESAGTSRVPQANGSDRWTAGDGGEVTLQSGANHPVVRDHWTGLAHLDPGGRFEGEINGTHQEFFFADPDGFRAYTPHDNRIVDPPSNDDGTTKERWTRENVERTLEVTNGNETVTGGPWVDLSGGADGLTITSTVTVTYTREWGPVGGNYNNNETVTVTSTQEINYDLRASVNEEVDITVYAVEREQGNQLWYEIDGNNTIGDAPVSEITVDAGSELSHTVTLPWQFMPMLDYDALETRTESGTNTESVSLDPTTPPWSSTTDYVAGGSIESGVAGHQLQAAENASVDDYAIHLPETVANGNHSFAVPRRFGGDASRLEKAGSFEEFDSADVTAQTIYGTGSGGTGINSTSVKHIEYAETNIRATFYSGGQNENTTVQILLEDEYGVPVPNRTLEIEGAEETTVTTDEDGRAEVVPTGGTVNIVFSGDPLDTDADILFAQSSTTVSSPSTQGQSGGVFDEIGLLMEMIVFFSPVLAFGIGLAIWKGIFGKNRS